MKGIPWAVNKMPAASLSMLMRKRFRDIGSGHLQFIPQTKVVMDGIVIDRFIRAKKPRCFAVLSGALPFDIELKPFHPAILRLAP